MNNVTTIESRLRASSGYSTGFDYLRFGLAAAVLVWHSYTQSNYYEGIFYLWTFPVLKYALHAILPMFFALSGFLVSASLFRSGTLVKFASLRVLRIFPALVVEVIVSALILGPIVTQLPLREYFSGAEFYSYFWNLIGWIHYQLPGVFVGQPNSGIVNTSLWTVPFELECYIALVVLALIRMIKSFTKALISLAVATVLVLVVNQMNHNYGLHVGAVDGRILVLCFLAGVAVYMGRDKLPVSKWWFLGSVLITGALITNSQLVYFCPIFVAYFTVYLGLMKPRKIPVLMDGDYSYGLYLYAAPVQQTIIWALGDRNNWLYNVALTLPITLLIAFVSWHVIEKPTLKLKKFLVRKPLRNPNLAEKPTDAFPSPRPSAAGSAKISAGSGGLGVRGA